MAWRRITAQIVGAVLVNVRDRPPKPLGNHAQLTPGLQRSVLETALDGRSERSPEQLAVLLATASERPVDFLS